MIHRHYDEERDAMSVAAEYRVLRRQLGSQEAVARLLGVSRGTLVAREAGKRRVTAEMLMALRYLVSQQDKR